ncbi:MAG: hypothetical protein HYU69_00180 [Bacteroidetes bacterium]|nr:hypothetical protein [Bacteroidota bacterium]
MIRYAVLLINMLGLFIYNLFVADGVTVTQAVPAELKPGSEYTIELTINKGAIGGFAKLQQELPEGITATAVDSKGASFSFSGNAVKFIWTSLPAEPEFKINYKIAVAANAPTGEKMIAGKFFYVTDNVKQSVEIPESKLNISNGSPVVSANETTTPVPDTPDETETDTEQDETEQPQNLVEPPKEEVVKEEPETPAQNNTDNNTPTNTPSETATQSEKNSSVSSPSPVTGNGLNCVRKITASGENEYTVELFITRGNITGFGKIQENLPAGLTASPVQGSGSSFSFADQKVKLVWVSFPTDAEFKVVYKLTGTPAANSSIDGLLSYIENDETKKIIIAATPISAGDQNTTQVNEPVKTVTDESRNTTAESNLTTPVVPQGQASVNYKVQICALRQTPVEASYFTARFGFGKVDTELHEGWSKYTVGGFNEYKDARDNREEVRTKGVVGPFVTAYNTGKRITVQEALMITSQKWYK